MIQASEELGDTSKRPKLICARYQEINVVKYIVHNIHVKLGGVL